MIALKKIGENRYVWTFSEKKNSTRLNFVYIAPLKEKTKRILALEESDWNNFTCHVNM